MHEPFEPRCTFCAKFVRCYADDSLLADWGYCADGRHGPAPAREALVKLEKEARAGNYRRLFGGAATLGLYPETDDGCERFLPRRARPARFRGRGARPS